MGMTKLAGYLRCLSVIESTIPKSKKIALATIFPPIVLGIAPTAVRPSSASHSYFNASSDFLTEIVVGIIASHVPRLLDKTHLPLEPSLSESAMGVLASSVRVAQPATRKISGNSKYVLLESAKRRRRLIRASWEVNKNIASSLGVGISFYYSGHEDARAVAKHSNGLWERIPAYPKTAGTPTETFDDSGILPHPPPLKQSGGQ